MFFKNFYTHFYLKVFSIPNLNKMLSVFYSLDYFFNVGLHYFIPIIAVSVVCITLFFCKGAPVEDEEYLAPSGLNQDEFTKSSFF